ncbi:hypothetical protein EMGBS15_18120 [Filimonas sp.]|nr:hypothetical protein EMGBS15_18120 [Filimonas sp.]
MYSEDTQQQSLENVVCFKILTKKNPMDQIPNSKEEKRNPTIEIRRRKFKKDLPPIAYSQGSLLLIILLRNTLISVISCCTEALSVPS